MTEEIIINGGRMAGIKTLRSKLKCLEQERDEWKKKYEDVANENLKEIYELIKKNDCWRGVVNVVCSKLEQENKELKEKIKDKPLQCIFYNDKQNKCALFTKTVAYHCALKEIREKIESLNKDICNNCGWYDTDNCQPNGYVCHDLIEIKNKINEVLDNVESK